MVVGEETGWVSVDSTKGVTWPVHGAINSIAGHALASEVYWLEA